MEEMSQEPVAPACNLSYSGRRDQEDCDSKSTWANSSWDPISKLPNTEQGWSSDLSGRAPAQQAW
jgi:hypothetical protein